MSSDEQPPVDSAAEPGDDATQVMPAVPPKPSTMPSAVTPAGGEPPVPPPPAGRSKAARFAVWLAIILMLLLLASVIAALLTRGDSTPEVSASVSESPSVTPSPSPSPSVTPSPSPTPTETTEAPSGPRFTLFSVPQEALCPDESTTLDVTVTWESEGADRAWVGIATTNAKDEPFSEVPTSGSVALPFPCSNESQVYTVTLEGAGGELESESETVTRNLG